MQRVEKAEEKTHRAPQSGVIPSKLRQKHFWPWSSLSTRTARPLFSHPSTTENAKKDSA